MVGTYVSLLMHTGFMRNIWVKLATFERCTYSFIVLIVMCSVLPPAAQMGQVPDERTRAPNMGNVPQYWICSSNEHE